MPKLEKEDVGYERKPASEKENIPWNATRNLVAGQTIETSVDGEVIGSYTVPVGKKAEVHIRSNAVESNA